jgi:hypothetical protein
MKPTLVLLSLLICMGSAAQVFPIQVSAHLTPPYSPYLSDYTSPGAQNFVIQIRGNDITLANYACKLRISIEGVGISIATKQNLMLQPLVLQGGAMQHVLYGSDLSEYFHPNALEFSGLTRSEYVKSGRLPEGVYRFTVEVLDFNRGIVVSNKSISTAWIILNNPPLLNLPFNLSRLDVQDPARILFTWTPRHTGSPNAAFATEYIFRLIEVWPNDRNPFNAVLTQSPLYETTTTQNQLLYGMNEPALLPGKKYAWQVEARDTGGKDLFKNNGRSEVYVFEYGEALAVPQNLNMRWAKPTTLSIRWSTVANETEEIKYRLQYRLRKRNPDHQWYETRTKFTEKTLYDLETDTEYEMRVRAEKLVQESAYSEIRIFKTLPADADEFVCKEETEPVPLPENTLPVFQLAINDTVHAGGYDVMVRDVMVIGGKCYGSGVAIVPWFNEAKVRVTFEGIKVNDRFWLTSGSINSVWAQQSTFVLEAETAASAGNAAEIGEQDVSAMAADTLITIEGAAIISATKDKAGNVVISTSDGAEHTLRKGESYVIVDEFGNGYVVDREGNATKTTASEARAVAARGQQNTNTKVPSTGSPTGGASRSLKLISEILTGFQLQISEIIAGRKPSFPKGAGPMADRYDPPKPAACLPDDHEKLAIIYHYLDKLKADTSALSALVRQVFAETKNKELLNDLANRTNERNVEYKSLLASEEMQKAEEIVCPYVIENAKQNYGSIWWRSPLWERAANTLSKHFLKQGLQSSVVCKSKECTTTVELNISDEVTSSFDVAFDSEQNQDQVSMLLAHYGIDALRILDATEEDFTEWWWNWMALQDARIYERDHGGVAVIEFIADIIMAPTLYPAISGWATGHHWRDGRELSGWEQALSALDFLAAEEVIKGGITNFVVRIGQKSVRLLNLSKANKYLLQKCIRDGLKFSVIADDEIIILIKEGDEVGRIVNNVLTVKYGKFGGDVVCEATKTTTVIGRYEDLVDGGGIKTIKDNKLYNYGENPGGINILDDPQWDWPLNEKWLKEALDRGDVIRAISNPSKIENLWVDGIVGGKPRPFGQEVDLLQKLGYRFDFNNFIFTK